MVVFLAHRHNHGTYWRPRKSCQYPGHEGKKIALYCKNPINWQMAHEIREMFVTLVQVLFLLCEKYTTVLISSQADHKFLS